MGQLCQGIPTISTVQYSSNTVPVWAIRQATHTTAKITKVMICTILLGASITGETHQCHGRCTLSTSHDRTKCIGCQLCSEQIPVSGLILFNCPEKGVGFLIAHAPSLLPCPVTGTELSNPKLVCYSLILRSVAMWPQQSAYTCPECLAVSSLNQMREEFLHLQGRSYLLSTQWPRGEERLTQICFLPSRPEGGRLQRARDL